MTTSVTNSPLTSDVSSILNPAKDPGRQVTADITNGNVNSSVKSAGDSKVFEGASKQLGKQDFLQLLVTQMRYQDPLAPQDNQQFISQMAQFSALEGTSNINTSIESLGKQITDLVTNQSASATTISNASATNLMGKYVRVSAKDVVYTSGQSSPIQLNVHTDAGQDSVLSILDKDGAIVNVLPMKGGMETNVSWDGTRMDGKKAGTGTYSLKVTSKDGVTETGYAFFENKVTGISFAKGGTRLEINGQTVGMDQVVRVGEEPTTVAGE